MKKTREKNELERELRDQFGSDNVNKSANFQLMSLKENYKVLKEQNGGQTTMQEKV